MISRCTIETHNTNEQMLFSSVQHFSEQRGKPSVILRLEDRTADKSFETEALIDPGSYQGQTTSEEPFLATLVKISLIKLS